MFLIPTDSIRIIDISTFKNNCPLGGVILILILSPQFIILEHGMGIVILMFSLRLAVCVVFKKLIDDA